MKKASEGIEITELMEDIDTNLTYGGARRISEYEAELLDQMDEILDYQIKMQRDLDYAKKQEEKAKKDLKKTEVAISEYCSETTKNKILLARGWQFTPEKAQAISEALSDKELLEQTSKTVQQERMYI